MSQKPTNPFAGQTTPATTTPTNKNGLHGCRVELLVAGEENETLSSHQAKRASNNDNDEMYLLELGDEEEEAVAGNFGVSTKQSVNHSHHRVSCSSQQQNLGTSQTLFEINHSLKSLKSSKRKEFFKTAEEKETAEEKVKKEYATHPYLLNFLDPEVEKRYFNFQYVDNAFIPGKVFSMMWTSVSMLSFIYFTEFWYNDAQYMVESFTSIWWIGAWISMVLNFVLGVGLFVDRLRPYREIIHLLQLAIGWPAFIMFFLIIKRPHAYTYCQTFGSFFSCMIAQARMRSSLFLVAFWPIICLLVVSFSVREYWQTHTKIEMLYWAFTIVPLLLLSFLEKRTRRSFMEREMSLRAIEEIEHRTTFTQRMIANFFPETPTRDLLQRVGGPREKAYPDTVVVITDIVGFTAHTSRTDPSDVIDMITNMFQAFNNTAHFFSIEKIATVGDSYCGAVFPTATLTDAERCVNGLQFACSTLGFVGSGLELRVGVHIGDVVGIFVGCAPPKFDIFGPGIDLARTLEEEGKGGFVHLSQAVAFTTQTLDLPSATEYGFLCREWEETVPATNYQLIEQQQKQQIPPHSPTSPSAALVGEGEGESLPHRHHPYQLNSTEIVEALCNFAGLVPPPNAPVEFEPIHTNDENGDHITEFDFHPLLLKFNNPRVESKYQRHVQNTGFNDFCCRVFLFVASGLFLIQLNVQCVEKQDMAVASATVGILILISHYIQFIGTNHNYHGLFTCLVYNSMMILSFLGLTSQCGGLRLRAKYVGDIAGCYACVCLFAPQYCLDVRMIMRLGMVTLTCTLWVVCVAIRRATYEDQVGVWDAIPLCGMCFIIMSFFPDYSLRSAFRTGLLLNKQQEAAKSRGAAMATSALSIMLPKFVTDKLISISKSQAKDIKLCSQASTGASSDIIAEIDFNCLSATWEYNHAVIMFIQFESIHSSFTPEKINIVIEQIEEIVKRHDVMKVKTIGSTVMLVSGVDDARTRQEHVTSMADAAILVRGAIFEGVEIPELKFKIGIHCGPCFGAVIGGNGAIFDLFGDTVNIASRMMTTAESGSIQLSSAARALLLPQLCDVVKSQPLLVNVKGKGMMEVFKIEPDVTPEQLPAFLQFSHHQKKAAASSSSRNKEEEETPQRKLKVPFDTASSSQASNRQTSPSTVVFPADLHSPNIKTQKKT